MIHDLNQFGLHIKAKATSTLNNMRKADLIEYIRDLEHNYNVAVDFNEQQARNCEKLLKDAKVQDWTPCSDHKPEESGDYLVFHHAGFCQVVSYSERYDAWNAVDRCYVAENVMEDIVAWMELPADYVPPEPEVIEHEN